MEWNPRTPLSPEFRRDLDPADRRAVRLDQHDSVRSHVSEQVQAEVAQLERRLALLRQNPSPHADILTATYQRLLDRKRGFLEHWDLGRRPG
ncbi:hypothetical protein [Marinobacter sp. C2H3]|uniref:hypothetical protein n=1 Tax=Marinobacter sp. C2H3 TaxID=3119003 RepID=UPI00300F2251